MHAACDYFLSEALRYNDETRVDTSYATIDKVYMNNHTYWEECRRKVSEILEWSEDIQAVKRMGNSIALAPIHLFRIQALL